MPTPANRAKIQLVRGSYSNISASIADLVDGELCYAKDLNRLFMVEGSTLTPVEADAEGIEDTVAAALAGGTGIDITYDDPVDTITVDLADTAVTPATYGSSTEIPQITVDQQGRITSATTAAISTDMTVAADSGSNETISIGTDTFTIAGGTGLTSTTTTDTVTVDLDDTAVTPAQYGSSSAIPIITVDQQGRITAASEVNFDTQTLALSVHNQTGADLSKGDAVYVSGTHTSGKPTVALADNDGTNTYPAIGLVGADITDGTDGEVIISGQLTNVDTSTYSAGAALYIDSTPGAVTTTRPTASTEKVQKVGLVTRSHASSGSILIIGAGRTNDVNNEIVALTGVALNDSDLGTFTGTTITDNSSIKTALQELETKTETAIVDADISATAEIAVSKLANGTARQLLQTSANGNDVEFTSNVDVPGTLDVTGDATFDQAVTITGDLTVNGTTTTIDSTTLTVEDKNIELGTVATPTDVTADGGGITLKGSTDHTIIWTDSTDSWDFSEHVDIASAKEYRIGGTKVLDATSLGSTVVSSSLTSVGTISTGTWNGTAIGVAYGGTGLTAAPTNGQLAIGNGTGYTLATLTAGTNITITEASGSITIDSTAGNGTVTSVDIATGTGLSSTGGPITTSGTITLSLDNTINAVTEFQLNGTSVLGFSGSDRILDNVIVDGGTY